MWLYDMVYDETWLWSANVLPESLASKCTIFVYTISLLDLVVYDMQPHIGVLGIYNHIGKVAVGI